MNIQSEKFEAWIRDMFASRQKREVCYHNIDHTTFVVQKVREMGEFYGFSDRDQEDLFYTAWLHDVGYWDGGAEGHEARGAEVAQTVLGDFGLSQDRIDRIKRAILATRMPQSPADLFESIVCDADLYHLGTESFYEQTLLLRREIEKGATNPVGLKDWLAESGRFTRNHRYHTGFGQRYLEPVKQTNLEYLDLKIGQLESEKHPAAGKEKKRKKDGSQPGHGA